LGWQLFNVAAWDRFSKTTAQLALGDEPPAAIRPPATFRSVYCGDSNI
jgi:hypothetical protein